MALIPVLKVLILLRRTERTKRERTRRNIGSQNNEYPCRPREQSKAGPTDWQNWSKTDYSNFCGTPNHVRRSVFLPRRALAKADERFARTIGLWRSADQGVDRWAFEP